MTSRAAQRDILSFGPFKLSVGGRLLTRDGVGLHLGARALDILVALVSRQNEPIGKKELMDEVWPDVTVTEGSLRFHVATLRKALGDGEDGARYITTLAGRGYCFVATITATDPQATENLPIDVGTPSPTVPSRLARMVGRNDGVLALSAQLATERFVTIVGAGGVGKTTVAIAVGNELIEAFAGAVLFVDLGALNDPKLVAGSIASMLGLSVQADDPTVVLIAYLRDKRVLLILDTCEHLMEAAAALTERIYFAAPQVHILATSREAFRVEGEHVYRLEPLGFPPDDTPLTAEEALAFPAVQLFVERAAANGARLDLDADDAVIVGGICRKLDGVALAIELAAGRVGAYGLKQTAELLDERLSLLWLGQRTAPARQQTLKATLDWSFGLLSELERRVLRRLAIFVGSFTLEAARAVLADEAEDANAIVGAVENLVAKSMLVTDVGIATVRYRLLDTTRGYVLDIEVDDAERAALAERHANYYRRWLEQTGGEQPSALSAAQRAHQFTSLANVRIALEWCFGPDGNTKTGIELAAAAAPYYWEKSQHSEGHRWAERAVAALDDRTRGGREEMQLLATLGMSLMFDRGETAAAQIALNRSLAIAERLGDALKQLQLLVPLHAFLTRTQDFKSALAHTERGVVAAHSTSDPNAIAFARTLHGLSLHFVGDLNGAREELEAGVQRVRGLQRADAIYLGAGHKLWAGMCLARTLWLQGLPSQAMARARQTVEEAAAQDASLSLVLSWSITVCLWSGDFQKAKEYIDWFVARAEPNTLLFAQGRGMKAQLSICRGDAETGVGPLQTVLDELHEVRHEFMSQLKITLAHGLGTLGRLSEATTVVDEAILATESNGDLIYLPELLRVKAGLIVAAPDPLLEDAEAHLARSLDLSRDLGALAWELRSSTDLAALWSRQNRKSDARALLKSVAERFAEGAETPDVKAASRLLASFS